ncbi:thiol-disulfide oxidoreductase DCC family protein [Agriterribacter sp.]|uniref:thiol-disulfide oxidoreductase DCC family protein n=1 Tax=Agriterribacter sp. TaxID=2821509 RepID=UPI002CC8435B|nr:thiol-disulfide oxidoreductase DCC family protein [Agriterribacter sp.]HTN05519.1 thiol-disulfide oxidoreductase DCC family protein [Agriterribacter sp.]
MHLPLSSPSCRVCYLCLVNTANPVILFDGVCNLCNSSVQFIIRHDKRKQFRFASLQGHAGQALLQQFNLPATHFNSFVLIEGNRLFTQSTAALRTFKTLGGAWSLLYGGIIIPPFIRNAIYRLIATNRYRWFGKRASCMVPPPGVKSRFLD